MSRNLVALILGMSAFFWFGFVGASTPSATGAQLMEMIQRHHENEALRLIELGAPPDFQDREGNSPLHYAAGFGSTRLVQALVRRFVDVNAINLLLDTPLHWAALGGHLEAMKILIAQGALIDAKADTGETPLHLAVDKGHLDAVRWLVDHHASLQETTCKGETVLDYALDLDIREFLAGKGAIHSPSPR